MMLAEVTTVPVVDQWIQYGCFGLVAVIVVSACYWGIPALMTRIEKMTESLTTNFRDEMKSTREWHEREIKATRDDCSGERELFRNAIDKLADRLSPPIHVTKPGNDSWGENQAKALGKS